MSIPPRAEWAGRFWSQIAGAEHLATRERAGLFDMSPLPKIEVTGPGAAEWIDPLISNTVPRRPGGISYALLLDDEGGIRSDITIARIDWDVFQIGANGLADLAYLRQNLPGDGSVQVRDVAGSLACLGLWGPRARDVIAQISNDDWSTGSFPYYSYRPRAIGEVPVRALRVSYVGELGWELYCSPEYGGRLWDRLWEAGREHGLVAAGRAAFDTLRLEKGYRLWGVDMHTEFRPQEAGVAFAVKAGKSSFRGREAALADEGPDARRLSCLRFVDSNVVVMGKEPVCQGNRVVGYVTSAGFGYSTGESLAYAWLPREIAMIETAVEVEYFGERYAAAVVSDPRWDPQGARLRL